jgi:hypothetical protein
MRYRHQPDRARQRCTDMVRDLAIPVPFDLGAFRACLKQRTGRVVEMLPAVMEPGAPSGTFFSTAGADYLYYEQRTTPFHQAHIVLSLTGRMLLGEMDGPSFDRRLVPDLSPQLIRLMLGQVADSTATRAEAETFAFLAMDRAHLAACSSFFARRALRQLRPLHSALCEAVPEATNAAASVGRSSTRLRLYQQVIEIRDAALALRRYRDPDVATAVAAAGRAAGLATVELTAVMEAAVLADAMHARNAGHPVRQQADEAALPPTIGADLRSETDWLVKVSRAFAESPLAGGPARDDPHASPRDGIAARVSTGRTLFR